MPYLGFQRQVHQVDQTWLPRCKVALLGAVPCICCAPLLKKMDKSTIQRNPCDYKGHTHTHYRSLMSKVQQKKHLLHAHGCSRTMLCLYWVTNYGTSTTVTCILIRCSPRTTKGSPLLASSFHQLFQCQLAAPVFVNALEDLLEELLVVFVVPFLGAALRVAPRGHQM